MKFYGGRPNLRGHGGKGAKVQKLSKGEILLVNIGSTSTGGKVLAMKKDMAKLALMQPVCTQQGEKIALSRRVDKHWRLIGWGQIRRGVQIECKEEQRFWVDHIYILARGWEGQRQRLVPTMTRPPHNHKTRPFRFLANFQQPLLKILCNTEYVRNYYYYVHAPDIKSSRERERAAETKKRSYIFSNSDREKGRVAGV